MFTALGFGAWGFRVCGPVFFAGWGGCLTVSWSILAAVRLVFLGDIFAEST